MLTTQEFQKYVADKEVDVKPEKLAEQAARTALHGALGLSGEAGEIVDVIKKFLINDKPLPLLDLMDEGGDALHYMQMLFNSMGVTMEQVMTLNKLKLDIRATNGKNKAIEKAYLEDQLKQWGLL